MANVNFRVIALIINICVGISPKIEFRSMLEPKTRKTEYDSFTGDSFKIMFMILGKLSFNILKKT